nr:MAG TPA: hypothetical protein [Caudoviricetes sp.]
MHLICTFFALVMNFYMLYNVNIRKFKTNKLLTLVKKSKYGASG